MRTDDFRQTLQCAPVDLAALLRRRRRSVSAVRPVPPPAPDVELADDLGTFEIDADKIAASVVNLLTNAIKFTPDGGEIALSSAA